MGRKFDQIARRGWTRTTFNETVNNAQMTRAAINRENNNPATAFFNADGSHVTRDNITGELIQLSDRMNPGTQGNGQGRCFFRGKGTARVGAFFEVRPRFAVELIRGLSSVAVYSVKWTPILGPRNKRESCVSIGKLGPQTGSPLPRTKPWHGNAVHSPRLSRPK